MTDHPVRKSDLPLGSFYATALCALMIVDGMSDDKAA